jgi:hypothetical protein
MTGRGMGYCSGYFQPGFGGWGRRGFGNGRRSFQDFPEDIPQRPFYGFPPFRDPSKEEEKRYLESLVDDMEKDLNEIKERLRELSGEHEG